MRKRSNDEQPSPGAALVSLRWAKATDAEKKAVGKMIRAAKAAKATLRAQTVSRRSRKPRKPEPKA